MEIDLTPFVNAGISGALLLWFMFRLERILNRFERSVQLMARAVIRLLERRDPEERRLVYSPPLSPGRDILEPNSTAHE